VILISAHIAGIPVEETALSFGPFVAVGAGVAIATARARLRALGDRLRPRRR
jgi:hypothetical protein